MRAERANVLALIRALRQKAAGERNSVGDVWGDHICADAADHIEAISSENEKLRAVLAKAKAFHDRDSGCNGFTADYEILRLEIDEALGVDFRRARASLQGEP